MKRSFIFILMFLLSVLCFAQQNVGIIVAGRIPDAADSNLYQMQVGAFRNFENASTAFEKLMAASLNPSYEEHMDLIRVMIKGVRARDVPAYIERIRRAGFSEVFIKIETAASPPVRRAVRTEEDFFSPESDTKIQPNVGTGNFPVENFPGYRTEPGFRLAYRFMNKGENIGASGKNGGVDIIGMDLDSEWLWTTYYQGGWFYDLNGINREMIDGYQKDPRNGVELTVKPEFVYDEGVYYLQLRHIVRNSGNAPARGQKFGASADVMIHKNDEAVLLRTPYGVYMTDSETDPSLELMFICESGDGIDPVDTLWTGKFGSGSHLEHIYKDSRSDSRNIDSAIGFSYQDIDLAPGQKKEFVVRFTLSP